MDIKNQIIQRGYQTYATLVSGITSRYPIGTNVFEKNWDVLILLDCCRVDALQQVSNEYNFINSVNDIISVGSMSSEWMATTFSSVEPNVVSNTAYLSANAWTKRVFEERKTPEEHIGGIQLISDWDIPYEEDFGKMEHTWRFQENPEENLTHPKYITDESIITWRNKRDIDRMIVHYQMPHSPYRARLLKQGITDKSKLKDWERSPWDYLKDGGDKNKVWEAYLNDLIFSLSWVKKLINNIDATNVVISADHGEAFGEWNLYGHGFGIPHPSVKKVPWCITSAVDEETYNPTKRESKAQSATEGQLEALGYM